MSGVSIIWTLLTEDADLIAVVDADNIAAGILPLKTALPGISIKTVDDEPRIPVDALGTARMITERVQVTVLAKTFPSKKSILELVRKALPISRGTVNGILCDSVLPDVTGPDIDEPDAEIYEQSRDFIVRWHQQ